MISGLVEVAPGIRFLPLRTPTLPPATHTNCIVLGLPPGTAGVSGADLAVVDPATPWDDERRRLGEAVDELTAEGGRVREIWLTHHHPDHVGAVAWLAARLGVPVVAHERTARLVAPALRVDRLAADGDTLDLGGLVLAVLHTPGHASGHLCLHDRASGTLIAGDMMAGVGTIIVDPPDGDMAEYLASLARLRALAPAVAVPAHGDPIRPAVPRIDEYIAHRLWREARVREALDAAAGTVGELVPRVYTDVAPALFGLAERSLLAHLGKLVKEGRAIEHPDGRFAPS